MMRYLLTVAVLAAVWVTLWESVSWANVIGGCAVAILVVLAIPRRRPAEIGAIRLLAASRLAGYFLWQLVKASLIVAWEIVTPGDRTRPGVVSVRLATRSPVIATVVANMVSLTPGTLSLELDTPTMTLYIHVLHLTSADHTRDEIGHLEALVAAALPTLEVA